MKKIIFLVVFMVLGWIDNSMAMLSRAFLRTRPQYHRTLCTKHSNISSQKKIQELLQEVKDNETQYFNARKYIDQVWWWHKDSSASEQERYKAIGGVSDQYYDVTKGYPARITEIMEIVQQESAAKDMRIKELESKISKE